MTKTLKIFYLAAIVFLFSACEKDGTLLASKIKAINKEFSISGFVLGDTVEQYFDGVKMREYYGQVRIEYAQNQLAFEKDEINMALKNKRTGETIYRQTFNIKDKENIVPKFYYDGKTLSNVYTYPDPQGNDYTVNFYLDPASGPAPVNINLEVLEYYYDDTKPDPLIVVNTTIVPIIENVQPGQWTPYVKVPIPVVTKQRPDTELYPIVIVRDAKTKEYYIGKNRDQSTMYLEVPYEGVSPGKVQSFYFTRKISPEKLKYMEQNDLIQLFPRTN